MKKYICIIILLAVISTGWALLLTPFTSWDNLIERSSDIIIARCTAAEDGMAPKPPVIYGNLFTSDIEVISVLKGNTKLGLSHTATSYRPYRGEYFLVFADYFTYQTNSGYNAPEDYRVIPLVHYHGTNELSGKTLEEQIQLILNSRLKDLNEELARDSEEIIRVGTAMSNNVPPTIPTLPPTGGKEF